MDQATTGRIEALTDLLDWRRPVVDAINGLAVFEWDYPTELVQFDRACARRSIDRFLAGDAGANELDLWANAIESRDDVGFEAGHADQLKQFLFELANQELFEPWNRRRAKGWNEQLAEAGPT